ncbi:KpsF/GutQ family sugar-phosphate isomerase [Aetokthonos hydrillicola Thurmond2011]|jgi:arabinose-5-phosphate isomerase|uniref:KpsF/GutQ family sugar-phosphate isomerase n=1 Tax=Aetokthonos hydrillicola Thurmond2011 TaxID=2712845 RepID=A0AAP5I437_9CYAN|nr:KpsF/GutQ family sugar-phosphate isomerase [Aetokthonos hydrillicola]MBO3457621.1 KpsF/GutQ family sugar-phosphate isomerase [Aetokthonos hydrillicola CCALA 1050]MBW4587899.1 KpsF/GutQ family sugar-phosphate isomerase [Aetokthonos hydrillicola CCALA 1050]MDR9894697.1 KpsF/GutQ family sugar-phosphate isomerase [Aetokthonos hydrillicola Thurmond2011]
MDSLVTPIPVHQTVELLKLEANAIHQAAERLKVDQIEMALTLLASCRGKVIITGIGKSGIVAQKIVATLNSIGIVAVYLHPCDALHGDLGIVSAFDVVMLLSNSGETEELIEMIPHLKHRQVPMIAIVGNLNSTVAAQANVVLDATVVKEACPLNLAPTTSTIVALAIGDALAMTLMQMRGITPEDFAFNHPAGRLGKRLTLKVSDLMHCCPDSHTLLPQASWLEVVSAITQGGAGAVNIVNEQEQLVGLITDGDLRRCVQNTPSDQLENLTAGKIMTSHPIAVTPEILAYDALKLMEDRPSQISVLPVVDSEQRCLGLIRLHDILRSGL